MALGLGLGFGLAESCPSMIALDAGSGSACAATQLRDASVSGASALCGLRLGRE